MDEKNEIVTVGSQENNPLMIISAAIEKGMDMSQMEKLFDLQERWEKKESEKSFKRAMCEFMKNKPELIKSKKVAFKEVKYSYIPLPKIQKAIDPILPNYGFSYRWEASQTEKEITVYCVVSHVDGHEERTAISGPHDDSGKKSKIQQIASSKTYLERQTLLAAFGLSADEDDDGASGKQKPIVDPESDVFPQMEKAIKEGKTTIEGIEQKYKLTSTAKDKLINSIDADNLQMLFDLVEEKIPSAEYDNIKRIIENAERLNYPKVLFTLTKLKDDK